MAKSPTYYVLFYYRSMRLCKVSVNNPMKALKDIASMPTWDFTEAQCNAKLPGQLLPVRKWLLTVDKGG